MASYNLGACKMVQANAEPFYCGKNCQNSPFAASVGNNSAYFKLATKQTYLPHLHLTWRLPFYP